MDASAELKQERSPEAGTREIDDKERDLVRLAVKRSKQHEDFYKAEKEAALDDNRFIVDGEQWDSQLKKTREDDGLPCLVFNRAPAFVDRIVGEIKQQPPRARARAIGGRGNGDQANIITAIGKHVERRSRAERAYLQCVEQPITNGYPGFLLLSTEYVSRGNFEQEMRISHVVHQFSVKMDPSMVALAGPGEGGATWALIEWEITQAEFSERYPKASITPWEKATGDNQFWWQKDKVRIAKYFVATPETVKLLLFDDGMILEEGSDGHKAYLSQRPDAKPEKERETERWTIDHYIISGTEILAGPERWPGSYIPIVPVEPKHFWSDGRKKGRGVYRWGKDAGMMRNYAASKTVESISAGLTAQWIGTDAMFNGKQDEWESKKPLRVLTYMPDPTAGGQGGKPERVSPPQIPTGSVELLALSVDEEKACVGIDNSALGRKSNETSGKAIAARVQEAQVGHYAFVDNLAAAIEFLWIQMIELMPIIYDTQREFSVYGEDGREKEPIKVNQPDAANPGEKKNDLTFIKAANFEVEIDVGPTLKTQRQESVQALTTMAQTNPKIAELGGDLLARSVDFEFSDELADRLEATLPPEIRQLRNQQDETGAKIAQAVQATQQKAMEAFKAAEQKIQQLEQQVQAATQAMNDKGREYELKERELDIKELAVRMKGEPAAVAPAMPEGEDLEALKRENMAMRQIMSQLAPGVSVNEITARTQDAEMERAKREEQQLETMTAMMVQLAKSMESMAVQLGDAVVSGIGRAVNTPKELVKDSQGRITGVRSVGGEA